MANTIQIRRGSKASLPTLAQGELAFCTDTDDVFIGDGVGNVQLGNVVGPSSAVTDGHLVVWDGTTGKLIKDGGEPSSGSGIDEETANSLTLAQSY